MSAHRIGFLGLGVLVAALGTASAVAKEAPDAPHWRHTYGDALLEARLRNVPVLVSRHKDT